MSEGPPKMNRDPLRWVNLPRHVTAILLATVALVAPTISQAQQRPAPPQTSQLAEVGKPGWTVDATNGCWIWNPRPHGGEIGRWSGACPRGPATGAGTQEWQLEVRGTINTSRYVGNFANGRPEGRGSFTHRLESYVGDFRNGRYHGNGTMVLGNSRYEGQWRDGKPNGTGTLTLLLSGDSASGQWRNGCMPYRDQMLRFMARIEDCGLSPSSAPSRRPAR